VLVIHGRGAGNEIGGAVLRERLPDWLVKSPNGKIVLAFAPAPSKLGGAGATLVLLRRR
jgi:DNA-nicking Smr family endonuclease